MDNDNANAVNAATAAAEAGSVFGHGADEGLPRENGANGAQRRLVGFTSTR